MVAMHVIPFDEAHHAVGPTGACVASPEGIDTVFLPVDLRHFKDSWIFIVLEFSARQMEDVVPFI